MQNPQERLWATAEHALRRRKAADDVEPAARPPRLRLVTPQPAEQPLMERPELRGWILAAGGVIVALALVAGWLAGGRARSDAPAGAPAPRTASAGAAGFAVDPSWTPAKRIPGLAGLDAKSSTAFSIAPGIPAYAIAGLDPVEDATLTPAWLRSAIQGTLPAPHKSKLLGSDAWTYEALRLRDGRWLEATVVPTTGGVVSLTCLAPPGSWIAAQGCAAGLVRLSVRGAERLTPSAGLGRPQAPARGCLGARRAPRGAATGAGRRQDAAGAGPGRRAALERLRRRGRQAHPGRSRRREGRGEPAGRRGRAAADVRRGRQREAGRVPAGPRRRRARRRRAEDRARAPCVRARGGRPARGRG